MRAMLDQSHIGLLRAIRRTIGQDKALAGWLEPGESGRPGLVIEAFDSEPWASLTFTGRRHRLAIALDGPHDAVEHAYDRLQALLTEPDIELAGQFLADIELVESEGEIRTDGSMRLTILFEALTIEE